MKKINIKISFMVMLLSILTITGCNSNDKNSNGEETDLSSEVTATLNDLKISGLEDIEIAKGQYFNPLKNVKVTLLDKDLTSSLIVKGNVTYGKVGNYTLIYQINCLNEEIIRQRHISVVDKPIENIEYVNNNVSETINLGSGSYRKVNNGEMSFEPPLPTHLDNELRNKPIPTSSWWTSLLSENRGGGNGIYLNPLRSSFLGDGVEITNNSNGFIQYWTDKDNSLSVAQFATPSSHLYVNVPTLASQYYFETNVIDYSDNNVIISMRDGNSLTDELVVTYTQGSPYVFFETNGDEATINLATGGAVGAPYEFYFLDGSKISDDELLLDSFIIKLCKVHTGYKCDIPNTPDSTLPKDPIFADKYYLVTLPQPSTVNFKHQFGISSNYKDKIEMKFLKGNYFSICSLNNLSEASFYHNHAYSAIKKSNVYYKVDHNTNQVISSYENAYQNFKGNNETCAIALLPHQYKYSNANLTDHYYETFRGKQYVIEDNKFETIQKFSGLLPTYTLPKGDNFDKDTMKRYLSILDNNTNKTFGDTDKNRQGPYWDSKTLYPAASGAIFANQLNEKEYQDKFVGKIKNILSDWFTYSSTSDKKYLVYNNEYNTMYYSNNDFNTGSELSDHHFTHGYLLFAFAVASMYDDAFYQEYKDIATNLLYDYMNPNRNDKNYPYLRTFDKFAGHSWAHGFGFFSEGNNQESSGEALNSWLAGYLMGLKENNQKIIDVAIYGFVTELNSIKNYVFDYDKDVFNEEYRNNAGISSIIWGGKNTMATWFGLNPNFIYGIHYLPIGEYVSSYAIDELEVNRLQEIYKQYEKHIDIYSGNKKTWLANMLSVKSLFDSKDAISNFDEDFMLKDDYPSDIASAYWMINANDYLGHRSSDLIICNSKVAFDVYKNNDQYYVQLLNITNKVQKVIVKDNNLNVIKEIKVEANSFICEKI